MSNWEQAAKELSDARREFAEAESRLAVARASLSRAENAFDTLWKKKTEYLEPRKYSDGWQA
jgi:hypothetical protein